MSVKEEMLKAREFIKAKRFHEARAILEKIDHPTAKQWLAKLDTIAPKGNKSAQKRAKPPKAETPPITAAAGRIAARFCINRGDFCAFR
jgi:hypothetical protein